LRNFPKIELSFIRSNRRCLLGSGKQKRDPCIVWKIERTAGKLIMLTIISYAVICHLHTSENPEPVLINVYGAPELIPRNEFRQPM
jgi:hypothetical protein